MQISKRHKELQQSPSSIMVGHGICSLDPYDEKNPNGYLNFGTAENHIMYDLLLPELNKPLCLNKTHLPYNSLHGRQDTTEALAKFLELFLNVKPLNFENMILQTGLSAVCESLSFCMMDEGDYIMIPTPYYPGFDHDFTKRFKGQILRVPLSKDHNYAHNILAFKKAFDGCPEKKRIKAVLITHPHNPTAEIISEQFFEEISQFCLDNNLQLLSDEIYALSTFPKKNHQSLYQYAKNKGVNAHLMYGLAKDFAMAGFKVGVFYSEDEQITAAMRELSYFHPVSTPTQQLITHFFSNTKFISSYTETLSKRLSDIHQKLTRELNEFNFLPAQAGLFMLLDLSAYCPSKEAELKLFHTLLNDYKINMTPGSELGLTDYGFFRVCFAHENNAINEFISRLKRFQQTCGSN